jgi:hypothetical protein
MFSLSDTKFAAHGEIGEIQGPVKIVGPEVGVEVFLGPDSADARVLL